MNQAVDERGLGGKGNLQRFIKLSTFEAMGADNEVRPEQQSHRYTFDDVQGVWFLSYL